MLGKINLNLDTFEGGLMRDDEEIKMSIKKKKKKSKVCMTPDYKFYSNS